MVGYNIHNISREVKYKIYCDQIIKIIFTAALIVTSNK